MALGSQCLPPKRPTPTRRGRRGIWLLSLLVGTVGGIYGIGGGSILAPILLALGYSAYEVAPATLAATFLASIGGIVGVFLGAGGFAGSYFGARLQRHLPERTLRRLLGLIACVVAARYIQTSVEPAPSTQLAHAAAR